jgi:hypothetical protein
MTLQSTEDDGTGPWSHLLSPTTMTHTHEYRTLFSNNSGWYMQTSRHSLTLGRELCHTRRRLQPREKTPPRMSSISANCLRSSHQLPMNPAGGHSGDYSKPLTTRLCAQAHAQLWPREKRSPCPASISANCPGSSHQLPTNPAGGHSNDCSKPLPTRLCAYA